jgi:hypothetical protein
MAGPCLGAQFSSCLLYVVVVGHRTQVFRMQVTPEGDYQRNVQKRDRHVLYGMLRGPAWLFLTRGVYTRIPHSVCRYGSNRSFMSCKIGVACWARWQVDIAGRGRYDSPEYCGTFLNAIPRSEIEVLRINPLLVSVNSLRFPRQPSAACPSYQILFSSQRCGIC